MLRAKTAVRLTLGMMIAVAAVAPARAASGDLDRTFGKSGKVTTPIGSSSDRGKAVALQVDGRSSSPGRRASTATTTSPW